MYLLTVTLMIIAVLGTYTQVLGLQTARAYSKQTAFAQAMIEWHNNALAQAQNNMTSADFVTAGVGGCTLTQSLAAPAACQNSNTTYKGTVFVYNASFPAVNSNGGTNTSPLCSDTPNGPPNTPPCKTSLPAGYSANLQFYSVVYQFTYNGQPQNLVMTFLFQPAADVTPPYLTLASGQQIGLTESDLEKQLQNLGQPFATYGQVKGGQIVTQGNSGPPNYAPITYPVPTGIVGLTDNTVALVSSPELPHCPASQTYDQINGTCNCPVGETYDRVNGTCS